MKRITYLLLLLLVTFSFSCEVEENQEFTPTEENLILSTKGVDGGSFTYSLEADPAYFETYMQWTSFISGRLLKNDAAYRIQFINLLGSGDVISLNDLLIPSQNDPSFSFEFRKLFIDFVAGSLPDPDHDGSTPPPPGTPPFAGYSLEEATVLVDNIIAFLIDENCVELYFPSGMLFVKNYTITTTAHPLNRDDFNEGYVRYYQTIYNDDFPLGTDTGEVVVDDPYVANPNNRNIIVTRPVRDLFSSNGCEYDEYSEIVFTDFLE